jgi:hypothetical protein
MTIQRPLGPAALCSGASSLKPVLNWTWLSPPSPLGVLLQDSLRHRKVPKKKPRAAVAPGLVIVPPTSPRESHPQEKWLSVAGPGRQNGTKFKSTCLALNTQGGVQPQLVMGFPPHHRFPPKRNPKPRCAPRRRGFSLRRRAELPRGLP